MRRACEYAVSRAIGAFAIDREGAGRRRFADAGRGALELVDVELDAEAIGALGGGWAARCGVELVSARVDALTGRIPWEAIGRESCSLEARGVSATAKCVAARETEVLETLDGDDEAPSKASTVMRAVLNALCRGLRARLRDATIVVQDASGVGRFLVRLDLAEYTHGVGVKFEGLSVSRIADGLECSVSEPIVRGVRGHAEIPHDFSRIDVKLAEIEATATVLTMKNIGEIIRGRGDTTTVSRERSSEKPHAKRSFIDSLLGVDLSASALSASQYEEASESMYDSVYEDSNEEFFDADEAMRELSESLVCDDERTESSSNGGIAITITCPDLVMNAPFDNAVCTTIVRSVRVKLDHSLQIDCEGLRFSYGFDEDHKVELMLHAIAGEPGCAIILGDDSLSVKLGHLKLTVNGVDCISSVPTDGAVSASVYWLEDPSYPMDASLPSRCLAAVRGVDTEKDECLSLREQLASDSSFFVKLHVPSADVLMSADTLESLSIIIQSMYELPDHHPLALRTPTPDSVLNPLVVALDLLNIRVRLEEPRVCGEDKAERAPGADESSTVLCDFEKIHCFFATNISGSLGSDFVWAQFARARAVVDGVEVAVAHSPGREDGSGRSSISFARVSGAQSCIDANIVGASVSMTQCETLIERLNTFLTVAETEAPPPSSPDVPYFDLRLLNFALLYKSNQSYGLIRNDFLRISSKQGDEDNPSTSALGIEIVCTETNFFVAPPGVHDTGGIQSLAGFPFNNASLNEARFASICSAQAVVLSTLSSTAKTAIATLRVNSCSVTLHKDTLCATKRLLTPEVELLDRPVSPSDDSEYVFVSPVKKAREVAVHARYDSDVTVSQILEAARDREMPPKTRNQGRVVAEPRRRPLLSRPENVQTGPNIIENFFHRETRRVRRKRSQPLFASGSVTAMRRHNSARERVSDTNMSLMRRNRFMGEFGAPSAFPMLQRRQPAFMEDTQTRYLPLPKNAVVPTSTIHVSGKVFEVRVLPGMFWSPTNSPRHADSVENNPLGSSAGIKLCLKTNSIRSDSFPSNDGDIAHRVVFSVRDVLCTDVTSGATWPNVLKYDARLGDREDQTDMCSLDVTAVRCGDSDSHMDLEYLLKAFSLPMHVKLDQRVVKLLTDVFCDESDSSVVSVESEDGAYFQKIEVGRTSLRLDYCGRQVDIDSLRSGNLLEVLNLVPWDGVLLDIEPIRLTGLSGVSSAAQAVIKRWLEDVTRTQAHKFVQGVKPIKSATNIGRRAAGVVAKPLDYHRNRKRGGFIAGFALGVASFVKEVSLTSMELGAYAAGQSAALLDAAEHMIEEHAREADDNEPSNVLQGLSLASKAAWRGAGRAATAVVMDPIRDYRAGDTSSSAALLGAVRRVPYATVTGARGLTKAIDHALSGAVASFRPPRAPTPSLETVDDDESSVARD